MKKQSNSKKVTLPKIFGDKSPIRISLCLGEFINGLHVDLIVIKEGKYRGSFATLILNSFTRKMDCLMFTQKFLNKSRQVIDDQKREQYNYSVLWYQSKRLD
jgi:hypothetical protein